MHLPTDGDAEVANLTGPCKAAKPVRLHFHAFAGSATPRLKMILKPVHRFIKHDRRDAFGDMCALVERLAGLFDPVARRDAVQDLYGGRRRQARLMSKVTLSPSGSAAAMASMRAMSAAMSVPPIFAEWVR